MPGRRPPPLSGQTENTFNQGFLEALVELATVDIACGTHPIVLHQHDFNIDN